MAKDNNEEPEENDDNLFDDDDFGLPDLEYDELDDDLDSDDGDSGEMEFSLGDDDDPVASDNDSNEDISVDLDSVDLDNVDFDAIDSIGGDDDDDSDAFSGLDDLDIGSDDSDSSSDDDSDGGLMGGLEPADESDLDDDDFSGILEDADESDLEEELGSLGDDDDSDMNMVFEEESGDESDDFSDLGDFDDEDYEGLTDSSEDYSYAAETAEGGKTGFVKYIIIGISAILIIALGLIYFSGFFDDEKKDPPKIAKKAKAKPKPKPKPVEKKPAEKTPVETKPATSNNTAATTKSDPKPVVNTTPSSVAAGTITTLSERNGSAYIVVASFIDSDLANDHAKKLAAQGKSPFVIPPFGNTKYSRVGIAEFDSFEGAAASLDDFKAEYGDDIWALRY